MENKLVFTKKDEVWSDSLIFAENFNIAHKHVLDKIKKLTAELPTVKKIFIEVDYTNERNRTYKKYIMNRDGYMFLVMNVNTTKANDIKLKFIEAFNTMEKALLNQNNVSWIETRQFSIESRKEETDVIKKFVEYATKQGSKNAKFYYSNITKASYKALELLDQNKTTPIRDMLNIKDLLMLSTGEERVAETLEEGMEQELHYKEIYQLAKQRLEEICNIMKPKKRLLK